MEEQAEQGMSEREVLQVAVRPVDELLQQRRHTGEGLVVESRLTLDVRPKLELSWGVATRYWKHTLLLFHNKTGFCATDRPEDLGKHGRLIIETIRNDKQTLFLEEGTHFFTFVLRKPLFFGFLGEYRSNPLRFFVEVPSAQVVLGRIRAQEELLRLQHQIELSPLVSEAELNDAEVKVIESRRRLERAKNPPPPQPKHRDQPHRNPKVAAELHWLDGFIDAMTAKEMKQQEILKNPDFQKLSPESQAAVLRELDERLNPGEVTARQERNQP